ncbi:MAG TPA: amidase [Candidatus Limnocylindrales bacterium]|nr:amidase [Candidatus Limnocylindrales bacterium]
MELKKPAVRQVAEAVHRGEVTARQLIEEALERCNTLNSSLNTFVVIAGNEALKQADAVDAKVKNGQKLPLAGVSVAVKDDFCYSVLPTGFGSHAFKSFYSPYSAAAVEGLIAAGAVVVGKTNLDDLSLGSAAASSPAGPAVNPWAEDRVSGSAGAAAVAAGQCLLALESDSGGSLRQGASHCGVFGLRPTTGRISRHGLNTFASSFAQVGFTALHAEDLMEAFTAIAGFDARDASTAVCKEVPVDQKKEMEPTDVIIGCPAAIYNHLAPGYRAVVDRAREEYAAVGFKIIDLELDLFPEALLAYYIIASAEASSNHARFDGIRFGTAGDAANLEEFYCKSRSMALGREARRRSIFGTFLLSKGNYELYYRQALQVWSLVRQEFKEALAKCHLLLLPAVKSMPDPIAETVDFIRSYEEDFFCAPVSLTGLPSLCLPAGLVDGLPVGLQLVGRSFGDEMLTRMAGRLAQEIKLPPSGVL